MTDLLIRNARLVPLRGELLVQALVDVLVENGVVTDVRPGLEPVSYTHLTLPTNREV